MTYAQAALTITEREVEIDRATLFDRAMALGREGDVIGAVWFATMVGEPVVIRLPLRLPVSLARQFGFEVDQ